MGVLINMKTLGEILLEIYKCDPKYIVPMTGNRFAPTVDVKDKVGNWIGYRVLKIIPQVMAYEGDDYEQLPVAVVFRQSFVGPDAEDMVMQAMYWDRRSDVAEAFAKHEAQIAYTNRECFSRVMRLGGMNDRIAWFTDMRCHTYNLVKLNRVPWFYKG